MTTDTITPGLRNLAVEAAACFETATRENGDEYVRVRDGSPPWLQDLCREAHGRDKDGAPAMLPDDYRYRFTLDALRAIVDNDEGADLDEIRWDACEPNAYTGERLAWLASHSTRPGYVDEAVEEDGAAVFSRLPDGGIIDRLAGLGEQRERSEVFDLVVSFLDEREQQQD